LILTQFFSNSPLIEPKESYGVVIEDVSLLSRGEKLRRLNALDRHPDGFRPDHEWLITALPARVARNRALRVLASKTSWEDCPLWGALIPL
jgi:hypothetical protein